MRAGPGRPLRVFVYITEDENARTPNVAGRSDKLRAITSELCSSVNAGASIFGVGRFGIGPFGGAAVGQEKLVSAVLDADRRHAEDAIIAASAGYAGMFAGDR